MPKNVKLTIGDFSKYCQVTVKTLRHYEKLGLLVPNEVDEWTRYRYYDVAQMQQLNAILRLKAMGFTLEEKENIDVEYCEQVEEMHADTELIQFKRLPEIPTAVCMKCEGPYDNMQENFLEVFSYIAKQGYQVAGKHRIQYVEGRWNQKDPQKWVTIIQVPVEKRVTPSIDAL